MIVEHKVVNKNVERVSRAGVGLVVISCIVVESRMAVDGPFSDQRSLVLPCKLGAMGNIAASSAQSKSVGGCDTGH